MSWPKKEVVMLHLPKQNTAYLKMHTDGFARRTRLEL